MKKYLLVGGAATAVVLLVFASFTSVVGYNSVDSSEFVDSPLFYIRTNKINGNSNQNSIEAHYLGKEQGRIVPIPAINTEMHLIAKIIQKIQTLDKQTYSNLLDDTLDSLKKTEDINETVIEALHAFDNNVLTLPKTEALVHMVGSVEKPKDPPTFLCPFSFRTTTCDNFIWCLKQFLTLFILLIIIAGASVLNLITILLRCS